MSEPHYCPFCGPGQSSVSAYLDEYGFWVVGCGRCGAHGGKFVDKGTRERVIEVWNRRPSGGWEETERAIAEAPKTYIPALFIQIVKRSKEAWLNREVMLRMAGKAWDQE